ncbi:outer membrane beta-barrel protein (plasmid) [Halopseudomonas sp. SMJS2]|uniref:outer membrane protein n=1 Tax=Halopseudomonas sp. SMJS2 TaxID=3041098 RepID=UPI0024528B02|nr:outer membrane beta-barrel protein [Halopseudomonas sp. SMJS2]WGK63464.1 outer membrane beta-barrel protein [Halopseudomonas sp. SMJS2]
MKKTAIASILASVLVAPSAFAAGFDGFGVGLDMSLKSTGADLTNTFSSANFTGKESESLGGEQNVAAGIDLNYGFMINPEVLIRVGATATFGTQEIEDSSSSSVSDFGGVVSTFTGKGTVEESDHYSVYIAPGLLVTDNTLVYAKLAYHQMNLDVTRSTTVTDSFGSISDSVSMDKKFNGFGIGAGVETRLTENLFLSAEVQHVRYGKETIDSGTTEFGETFSDKIEPTSTIGTLGLAYRF